MSVEETNICDLKLCLKSAGIDDESMKKSDMLAFYDVIKSSESTAEKEKKRRMSAINNDLTLIKELPEIELSEKRSSFAPKGWSHSKNNEITIEPTTSKRTKLDFDDEINNVDIHNSNKNEHKALKIIYHEPNRPGPFYCQPSLRKLPMKERVLQISNYHSALAMELSKMQLKSTFFAKWDNPIQASAKFNGDLCKKINSDPLKIVECDESAESAIITTRAGRQVKRKFVAAQSPEPLSYGDEDDEDFKVKKSKKKPNDSAEVTRTSRSGAIIAKVQDVLIKKMAIEKQEQKFLSTIHDSSDDDDDDFKITMSKSANTSAPNNPANEPEISDFDRIRILPPSGRNRYRRAQQFIPVMSNSAPSTSTSTNGSKLDDKQAVASPKLKKKQPQTTCPICNQTFFTTEIEEHASTCGLTNELEIETNLPNQSTVSNRISCHVCEKVFLLDTDYEVHVQKCIGNP